MVWGRFRCPDYESQPCKSLAGFSGSVSIEIRIPTTYIKNVPFVNEFIASYGD